MVLSETSAVTCCNASLLGSGKESFSYVFAAARNQRRIKPCFLKPASVFVKNSPVPSRRPLRCVVPSSSLSANEPDQEQESVNEAAEGSGDGGVVAESRQKRKLGHVSSKWASLFEAASAPSSSSSDSSSVDDAGGGTDAWFDKIFPKTSGPGGGAAGSSKLNAQQEKSIQQLQSLVRTLGVATKNTPPPPARKNKPGKIRQLPVEGGGIDPVPFASILKKLQAVGRESRLDRQLESEGLLSSKVAELEIEKIPSGGEASPRKWEESTTVGVGGIEMDLKVDEETEEEETGVFSKKDAVEEMNELSKMTVPTLRGMAKSRGLSGYSRLKRVSINLMKQGTRSVQVKAL